MPTRSVPAALHRQLLHGAGRVVAGAGDVEDIARRLLPLRVEGLGHAVGDFGEDPHAHFHARAGGMPVQVEDAHAVPVEVEEVRQVMAPPRQAFGAAAEAAHMPLHGRAEGLVVEGLAPAQHRFRLGMGPAQPCHRLLVAAA